MYFYIYDSFLQDKKYSKPLADIEARLIDLSIQGRTSKLNILNDMKELINDAVKHGAQTIVILGDDKSVAKAMNSVIDLNVTLGIIPVGNSTHSFARHLGIPEGVPACEVLSKRIRERIDVARVNGNHFVYYLKALSPRMRIVSADGKYSITPLDQNAEIFICNFKPDQISIEARRSASFFVPHDGRFELVVRQQLETSFFNKMFSKQGDTIGDYTIIPFEKITIEPIDTESDVRLVLDNDKIIKPPVTIEVRPRQVECIVGSERQF